MDEPDLFSAKGAEELSELARRVRKAAQAAEADEQDPKGKEMWSALAHEAAFFAAWLDMATSWHREHRRKRPV